MNESQQDTPEWPGGPNARFWELADSFIRQANVLSQSDSIAQVSAAFMYAASRYNAFALQAQSGDLADHKDEALEYLSTQYKKMCHENIEIISSASAGA
jgi:hypothetical protein